MGVAIMSFKQSRDIIRSSCSAYIHFILIIGNIKQIKDPVKYVEVQNINPASINNFKNSIATVDVLSQLDVNVCTNPNVNYNILSSVIEQAKIRHIAKKINVLVVVSIVLKLG